MPNEKRPAVFAALVARVTALCALLLAGRALASYTPPGMGLDAWFIKEGATWHQFQLCGPYPEDLGKLWPQLPASQTGRKPSTHLEQGIYHSTSTDLITWRDEGVVLTIGAPGQWDDGAIYTGNIAKHGDTFYLFYTGLPAEPKPGLLPSLIGVATSEDLKTWAKHPANPILTPDPKYYNPQGNWRDCNFYWDAAAQTWYAVICASPKASGPGGQYACIGLAKSPDLIHWECLPPLVSSERFKLGLENPFLFPYQNRWYLGHSMYGQFFSEDWLKAHPGTEARGGAFYFVADCMTGPYRELPDPGLGTQSDPPPYAVQIVRNGGEYLYLHRGPGRWATALPKKIQFQPSGQMQLVYWPATRSALRESLASPGLSLPQRLDADVTSAALTLGTPGLSCELEAQLSLAPGAKLCLELGGTLRLSLDRDKGRVSLEDPATGQPLPGRFRPAVLGRPVSLRLVVDGSVADVYLDDQWLFAHQRPHPTQAEAALRALQGQGELLRLELRRLHTGNRVDRYGFNF